MDPIGPQVAEFANKGYQVGAEVVTTLTADYTTKQTFACEGGIIQESYTIIDSSVDPPSETSVPKTHAADECVEFSPGLTDMYSCGDCSGADDVFPALPTEPPTAPAVDPDNISAPATTACGVTALLVAFTAHALRL